MKLFTKERQLAPSWNLLNPSIELVKKYIWHIMYLSFLPALAIMVGAVLVGEDTAEIEAMTGRVVTGLAIIALAGIWNLLVFAGFTYFQSQAIQGKEVGVFEAFTKGLSRLLPLLGMMIVGGVLIFVGLLALILPGLILIRGFYLAPFYVVDRNMGPIEALRKSYRDSKPVTAWIWGVIGVELVFGILASILGNIAVIGYLLSLAVSYPYIFAGAIRYGEVTHKLKIPIK